MEICSCYTSYVFSSFSLKKIKWIWCINEKKNVDDRTIFIANCDLYTLDDLPSFEHFFNSFIKIERMHTFVEIYRIISGFELSAVCVCVPHEKSSRKMKIIKTPKKTRTTTFSFKLVFWFVLLGVSSIEIADDFSVYAWQATCALCAHTAHLSTQHTMCKCLKIQEKHSIYDIW